MLNDKQMIGIYLKTNKKSAFSDLMKNVKHLEKDQKFVLSLSEVGSSRQ